MWESFTREDKKETGNKAKVASEIVEVRIISHRLKVNFHRLAKENIHFKHFWNKF